MEAHSFPILYNSEPTAGQRGSWNRIEIKCVDVTNLKGDGLAREGFHEDLHGGVDLPDFSETIPIDQYIIVNQTHIVNTTIWDLVYMFLFAIGLAGAFALI